MRFHGIRAVVFAMGLTASQAFGATPSSGSSTPVSPVQASSSTPAPLPAGRAATVRDAQGIGRPLLYWLAGGAIIIGGVILISQNGDNTVVTTTTTGQ